MTTRLPGTSCPSQNLHQWHPQGYIGHSNWADDALTIAVQSKCPGCGELEIWTPRRPNLRLRGADWTGPNCVGILDGGGTCGAEAICERYVPEEVVGGWWPVCADHTGLPRAGR